MRRALAIAALLVSGVACGSGSSDAAVSLTDKFVSHPVRVVSGDSLDLAGGQQVVVIAFVAQWCVPCRTELPMMQTLAQKHQDVRFVAVGVNEEPDVTAGFLHQIGVTFESGADPQGQLYADLGFTSLPGTLVLNSDLTQKQRFPGRVNEAELESALSS